MKLQIFIPSNDLYFTAIDTNCNSCNIRPAHALIFYLWESFEMLVNNLSFNRILSKVTYSPFKFSVPCITFMWRIQQSNSEQASVHFYRFFHTCCLLMSLKFSQYFVMPYSSPFSVLMTKFSFFLVNDNEASNCNRPVTDLCGNWEHPIYITGHGGQLFIYFFFVCLFVRN